MDPANWNLDGSRHKSYFQQRRYGTSPQLGEADRSRSTTQYDKEPQATSPAGRLISQSLERQRSNGHVSGANVVAGPPASKTSPSAESNGSRQSSKRKQMIASVSTPTRWRKLTAVAALVLAVFGVHLLQSWMNPPQYPDPSSFGDADFTSSCARLSDLLVPERIGFLDQDTRINLTGQVDRILMAARDKDRKATLLSYMMPGPMATEMGSLHREGPQRASAVLLHGASLATEIVYRLQETSAAWGSLQDAVESARTSVRIEFDKAARPISKPYKNRADDDDAVYRSNRLRVQEMEATRALDLKMLDEMSQLARQGQQGCVRQAERFASFASKLRSISTTLPGDQHVDRVRTQAAFVTAVEALGGDGRYREWFGHVAPGGKIRSGFVRLCCTPFPQPGRFARRDRV
ncbi:hypothetical protein KC349_g2994 [Hortaea werneckii]|nr:hypothetical protein KC349_g2994 [Hortaea werneckii]